jgi:hypothetical protein
MPNERLGVATRSWKVRGSAGTGRSARPFAAGGRVRTSAGSPDDDDHAESGREGFRGSAMEGITSYYDGGVSWFTMIM